MLKQKKKRQHYVWRHYLRQWSIEEQIYCLMNGKIFKSNIMNVAQEKYFYKLKQLNTDEINFLKTMIEIDNRPLMKKLNYGWIEIFNKLFELKTLLNNKGISTLELENLFDVAICNFEEELHTQIEPIGDDFLKSLYNKDISFYQDESQTMSFFIFICQQYFRTKKMSVNIKNALLGFDKFNIDAMWSILRHILATQLGFSLYQDRNKYHLILLENTSPFPFITGDQPIINTYAVGLKLEEEVEELELYYPLTPNLALLISEKDEYSSSTVLSVSEYEVIEYNKWIYNESNSQIYASNKDILEKLLSSIQN